MNAPWNLDCCKRLSQRWVFGVMGSLGITNAYTMRICLSLAITNMVKSTKTLSNVTRSHEICPASESTSSNSTSGGIYEWDEYTQGVILSSFFWGYIVTQLPGGILAAKFGGKYILGIGIFCTAICTLLTPMVVQVYDSTGLIVLRVLMGLGEGTTFPAMSVLVAQWAPPNERSKMTAVVMSGTQVGTIFGTALSGILIQHSSIGWPMAFYVFGSFGILWFFAWVILCYNNPDVHPFISEEEKNYLRETMNEQTNRNPQPTPWRHMATSIPLWALLAGKIGREWGFQIMVTDLPKYMNDVLRFSTQANGFLTALPNGAMWVVGVGSSWIADWLIKSEKISRTNARKVFVTIASLGPAIFIISASYAGCDHSVVVILFTFSMAFMGLCYSGTSANILDLSPNHSGIVMAIMTVIGSLSGMLVPYAVGVLTPNRALSEWRIAFWITFSIFFMSALIFNLFADGEVQYWNDLDSRDDKGKDLEDKEEAPFVESSTEIKGT